MKTKNRFNYLLGMIAMLLAFSSCDTDWDKIYLSSLDSNKLTAADSKVVLTKDNSKEVMLSLAWTSQTIAISNPDMSVPNVLTTYLQASTKEDFSSNVVESQETNLSKAYLGSELNTLAKSLGMEGDVASNVYFRLKAYLGTNMSPVYSNTATVSVTPYTIDMTVGYVLDKNKALTAVTFASPNADGIYKGFMGVAGWANFFLQEGDGTTWGNDAVTQKPFEASSASGSWNFWFPGLSGCYYAIVNTPKKQWSALYLPSMKVSGDITADMTFDKSSLKWTAAFTAASAGNISIKLATTGLQYDYSTGTDDAQAVSTPFGFVQSGSNLAVASDAGTISVAVPQAGQYTLTLDLSNPKAFTCTAVAGSTPTPTVSQYLYIPGVDDGTSGSWTFNNSLNLYSEDNLAYAGVVNVNSQWGYTFNPTKDDWNDKYTMAGGDAYAGTLVAAGSTNVTAPTAGLYLFDVSLKALTYSLTSVGNQIYVSGLNDSWTFDVPLTETSTAGTYSGTITISKASAWGFTIYLIKDNWDLKFGGSAGKLYYKGANITDDAKLSAGTHTMTVNLVAGTYSIN